MRVTSFLLTTVALGVAVPARGASPESPRSVVAIEKVVKTKVRGYERLTMFLRPAKEGAGNGVLCLCLLGDSPLDIRRRLETTEKDGRQRLMLGYADDRNLAVVAWGSHTLWDPHHNWDELPREKAKKIASDFDLVASAWCRGMDEFADEFGIARDGYLILGTSGPAQYVQRLVLRRPERFLAAHIHVASSYDVPVKEGASVLWCVTSGENDPGYERSKRFFVAARDRGYPIIYKAYPGLGHEGSASVTSLGMICFEFAIWERNQMRRASGGKKSVPDWPRIFSESPRVADIYNQEIRLKSESADIPSSLRMPIPSGDICDIWLKE